MVSILRRKKVYIKRETPLSQKQKVKKAVGTVSKYGKKTAKATGIGMMGALLIISPILAVIAVLCIFNLFGPTVIEPSPDLLGLLIVAASFSFPIMVNVLMDRKAEPKDVPIALIVGSLGIAIFLGALSLTAGRNHNFAGLMMGGIGTIGVIMTSIAVIAIFWVFYSFIKR